MDELRGLQAGLVDGGEDSIAFLVHGARGQQSAVRLGKAKELLKSTDGTRPDVRPSCLAFGPTDYPQITLVFHDPSSLPQHPGWPLRNILYYLHTLGIAQLEVVCLRSGSASRRLRVRRPQDFGEADEPTRPSAVGWERNKAGKLASRVVDLGPMMDPARSVGNILVCRSDCPS